MDNDIQVIKHHGKLAVVKILLRNLDSLPYYSTFIASDLNNFKIGENVWLEDSNLIHELSDKKMLRILYGS